MSRCYRPMLPASVSNETVPGDAANGRTPGRLESRENIRPLLVSVVPPSFFAGNGGCRPVGRIREVVLRWEWLAVFILFFFSPLVSGRDGGKFYERGHSSFAQKVEN